MRKQKIQPKFGSVFNSAKMLYHITAIVRPLVFVSSDFLQVCSAHRIQVMGSLRLMFLIRGRFTEI